MMIVPCMVRAAANAIRSAALLGEPFGPHSQPPKWAKLRQRELRLTERNKMLQKILIRETRHYDLILLPCPHCGVSNELDVEDVFAVLS